MKKYKLGKVEGNGLRRVISLRDFGDVKKGQLGGFVRDEKNLSQDGDAWVSGNAWVFGNAQVYGDAWVYGNAQVFGDAWVYGDAQADSFVVFAYLKPYSITITKNHVQIGRELLRKDHLKADGLAAAKKHNMDKKTIAKYSAIVKALLAIGE